MLNSADAIFSALTPYLCVFVLFGAVIFFRQWRTRSKVVWALAVCSLFALTWRMLYPLESSRYAMFLLLPAVVTACYGIINLKTLLPKLNAKAVRWLQIILIIALPLGSLMKSWHFSPYYDSLKELGEIAGRDAKNFPQAVFFGSKIHENRFAYYSGLNSDNSLKKEPDFTPLKDLKWMVDSDMAFYIAAQVKNQEEDNLLEILSELPGKYEKLGERFVNRKKSRKFILYRYDPASRWKNALHRTQDLKFFPQLKNRYVNGGFEKVKPLVIPPEYKARFQDLAFFKRQGLLLPENFIICGLPGYSRLSAAEVEATAENPLDGKYSVRMKSDYDIYAALPYWGRPGNYKFGITIKVLHPSSFEVYIVPLTPHFSDMRRIAVRKFADRGIFRYELPILHSTMGVCNNFWIVIALRHGEVLLDNVSLTVE